MMMSELAGKEEKVAEEVKLIEARVSEKRELAKIDMETLNGSWLDEMVAVCIMLPVVVTFLNVLFTDERDMKVAWEALAGAPDWYVYLCVIVVLISMGAKSILQKLVDNYIANSKGKSV